MLRLDRKSPDLESLIRLPSRRTAMRRAIPRTALLIAVVIVCVALPGGARSGKPTSFNVTTIVHDTDTSGAPLLIRSDDYNGSGQATYSPSAVASYIFSDGRYFLRLYGQSVRTLFITPNDPINGSQPMAPPPGYYWQNVEFAVACHDQSGNIVPLPNIVNTTGNCIMILDFGYNGTEYKLAMGPNPNLPSPAPPTGLVTVTCNSVNNGECVNWTITPNMTASSSTPPTVASLYVYTGSHRTPLALVGQYYQTFRIDVTNP
jgi:hypothetical protein